MALHGGGGGSGAVRAGAAYVEIIGNNNPLSRTLQDTRRKLQSFGHGIKNIGLSIFGAGASVLAPLGVAFGEMLEHFGEVQDASDRLGTTTEAFTALSYAASQAGASVEDLE